MYYNSTIIGTIMLGPDAQMYFEKLAKCIAVARSHVHQIVFFLIHNTYSNC